VIEPLGEGRYRVTGGTEPHDVAVGEDAIICDCADARFRQRECKHARAVAYYLARHPRPAGSPVERPSLDELLARMERRWRPPLPIAPLPADALADLDWSPGRFPAYARMCHELGLPVYPDGAPTRAWWRQAAAGGVT
jgi:hypothetical protein